MKTVKLGSICADCFNALNFRLADLSAEEIERTRFASHALSELADDQDVVSLHTGDSAGFSFAPCGCCGNNLGGERWALVGLRQERKDIYD